MVETVALLINDDRHWIVIPACSLTRYFVSVHTR